MKNCGFDTETYLIGPPDNMIPKIVCASWDMAPQGAPFQVNGRDLASVFSGSEWQQVHSTGDGMELWDTNLGMWQQAYDEQVRIIIHNAKFDVGVALRYCIDVMNSQRPGRPEQARDLYLLIWDVLEKSLQNEWDTIQSKYHQTKPILVSCTLIREKLKNLSAHGGVEFFHGGRAQYGLANLVMHHLKINTFDKKVHQGGDGRTLDADGNDITGTAQAGAAWRLRYSELDNIPTYQWPREAWDYSLSDSTLARLVWEAQESKRSDYKSYSMNSESLQVYADICLGLTTAYGFRVDAQQREKIKTHLGQRLEVLNKILQDQGIVRPNGKLNTKVVKERCENLWEEMERQPIMTPHKDIATGKEVMEILAEFDPALQTYAERQKLIKVWDAFLPNLAGDRVYTNFDILKDTGRTSSRGNPKRKNQAPLYYAVNSQQMPRQPGVREVFLPEPGYVIVSTDWSTIELCSTAEVTYQLFGFSHHRDMINKGYDLHSYLGSGLAQKTMPELVDEYTQDRESAYRAFMAHRLDSIHDEDDSPEADKRRELKDAAGHYRNLAKPIGLGYPGGLSVKTMCVFAWTAYHVRVTEQQSTEFRRMWLDTYPEMVEYFKWVRGQTDPSRSGSDPKYCYETPGFCRWRSGATYCATANGMSMQSLSADGGKRSIAWLGRAFAGGLDGDNPYRILDACYPLTFIHDEHLTAIPDDELVTERALAVESLMHEAMKVHMPNVKIKAEPAVMRRWTKKADAEYQSSPGEQERALDRIAREYGIPISNQIAGMCRTQNPDLRLRAWDDFHEIPDLSY